MTVGWRYPVVLAHIALMTACGAPPGDPVEIVIPSGASFADVTDTLGSREIIGAPRLFAIYARVRRDDRKIKAGRYELPTGSRGEMSWISSPPEGS
jgi:cell division protein YceG involved in septum cleavage